MELELPLFAVRINPYLPFHKLCGRWVRSTDDCPVEEDDLPELAAFLFNAFLTHEERP